MREDTPRSPGMPLDEETRWRIAGENLTHVRRIHRPFDWSQHLGL